MENNTIRSKISKNTQELLSDLKSAIRHFSIHSSNPDDEIQHIEYKNAMNTLYSIQDNLEEKTKKR